MKRSFKRIGIFGAGAIALAAALASIPKANTTIVHAQEQKAALIEKKSQKSILVENHYSGLDLVTHWPNVGLSPKEYGQLYGCKKHSKKSNRKRLSHNAKLRRR